MAYMNVFEEFSALTVTSNPADGYGQAAIKIGENTPGRQQQMVLTIAEAWRLAECLIAECEKIEETHRRTRANVATLCATATELESWTAVNMPAPSWTAEPAIAADAE
jgi:hypothetical protein